MSAAVIDAMIADIAFTAPVAVEDCQAVYLALKEVILSAAVEVYFHTGLPEDEVIIRAGDVVRKVTIS